MAEQTYFEEADVPSVEDALPTDQHYDDQSDDQSQGPELVKKNEKNEKRVRDELREQFEEAMTQVRFFVVTHLTHFLNWGSQKILDKWAEIRPNLQQLRHRLFYLCFWPFIFLLTAQLIFSSGGIVDFQKKENILQKKEAQLHQLQLENELLYDEIIKIQTDPQYQKQLVRENLGHVSADEYVILFPNK